MLLRNYPFLLLILGCLVGACGVDRAIATSGGGDTGMFPAGGGGTGAFGTGGVCAYDQIICEGDVAKVCNGQGGYTRVTECKGACSPGIGCVSCIPNAGVCSGNVARLCDPTGSREDTFVCQGPGTSCDPDGCHGACSPTSLGMSYQGCEFWPTVTANHVWSDPNHQGDGGLHFGVLLGNVSAGPAAVQISGPGADQALTLAPGEVRGVPLDWVRELKGPDWTAPFIPSSPTASVKKTNGAYRVQSNTPIVVYQTNPIEGRVGNSKGCPVLANEAGCYSFSNDGSLLLPTHTLSSSYMATGYHAWHQEKFSQDPSGKLNIGDFIAITALSDTKITLALRPNQEVLAGADLPKFAAGEATTFTLGQGDVVQLFTPGKSDMDSFSGTEIVADQPFQLLSGVSCASIPEDGSPCGHVEDVVLPSDVLGKDYVVPALFPATSTVAPTPHVIRIQAIADGTAIKFEPTSFAGVTLNRGEALEMPGVTVDVRITGNQPFAVTQYMSGRGDYSKVFDGQNVGGPNQVSVTPSGQFRTDYQFITPLDYDSSFVSIVSPTGAQVSVDGEVLLPERFTAVGASGMSVARQPVARTNRVHTVKAEKPVGILVYGFDPFSSFLYAGGLDLKRAPAAVVR